jgi:hypothetical protein
MVQGKTPGSPPPVLNQEWIDLIDKAYTSPGRRATKVMAVLKEHDFLPYDLLCFAVEYAASQAVVVDDEHLLAAMKQVSRWLYGVHYFHTRELLGEPDLKRVSPENGNGILDESSDSSEGDAPSVEASE